MSLAALHEDEVGQLQELSCPFLAKLHPALLAVKLAEERPRAFGSKTVVMHACHGIELHMAYFPDTSSLVAAFKTSPDLIGVIMKLRAEFTLTENMDQPKWLAHLAPHAKLYIVWADIFNSLKGPKDSSLGDCVKIATGGLTPRKILCTGYCGGGAMATVAAVWMALQCPTADVRCMSFGSPKVGNAAFCEAFRWLVGRSYRVVYRRDPIPGKNDRALVHSLTHVHGAIYIASDQVQAGEQPSKARAHGGCADDHTIERYTEALHATVERHFEDMKAFAGGKPMVVFATAYMEMAGDEDEVASTSSSSPYLGPSPTTKLGADTGAAQAVRELKAKPSRSGVPAQDEQPAPDAVQMEAAAAQDAEPPAGDAVPVQVNMSHRQEEAATSAASKPSPSCLTRESVELSSSACMLAPAEAAQHALQAGQEGRSSTEERSRAFLHAALLGSAQEAAHMRKACSPHIKARRQALQEEEALASGGEQANQRPTVAQMKTMGSGALGNSETRRIVSDVVNDATDGDNNGIGPSDGEGGGSVWLKRAFSMLEQEDVEVDLEQLDTLAKVLVVGKLSQAVVLAGAAYRDEATFRERTGIANTKLVCDPVFDTQVHVGWLPGGTAILAFRGTESAQDGLQDVKIIRKNVDYMQEVFPGVQAHTGFMQQFAAVSSMAKPKESLAEVIKQLSGGQEPNRVLCCGHSLGGALATLAAAWASMTYPQADVRCMTFGSPRVGNDVFKKAFHSMVGTSIRVVHGGDLVPALPPAFTYKHVENCLHLRRGQIHLRHRPWHFKLRLNVGDHLVSGYAAGIWAHRPHGENQLPFLGRSKRDTTGQQAEDSSENDAPANQHNSMGLWRLLSCMPAVGLEDKLPTEEAEQHMDKIPAHLLPPSSSSYRIRV